jgi:hypothetical protein
LQPQLATNAPEFAVLSVDAIAKIKTWIAEASKDGVLSAADLSLLQQSLKVIEHTTYVEIDVKPG